MAYDYDPEDKFGYKDTLPENHPEKVITGVEFDEEFKKIEQAVQGLQNDINGKLDVVTSSLVMGGTYSLQSGLVVRSLKPTLIEGQPLPAPADCPDTFLICIDDGPFMGENLVRSDWIVSSGPENAWIPLAYSRQGANTGDPGSNGEDGKGWTAGNYNPSNGVVTFLSDDGLGFSTDDIRGDNGGIEEAPEDGVQYARQDATWTPVEVPEGGVSDWADLENKPTEFPPSAHTHEIAEVNGLQDALDNAGGGTSITYTLPVALRSGDAQLPLTLDGAKLAVMTRGGELELPLAA